MGRGGRVSEAFKCRIKTWKKSLLKIDFELVCFQTSYWSYHTSKTKAKIWNKCAIKRKIRDNNKKIISVGKSKEGEKNKSTQILLCSVTSTPCLLTSWEKYVVRNWVALNHHVHVDKPKYRAKYSTPSSFPLITSDHRNLQDMSPDVVWIWVLQL